MSGKFLARAFTLSLALALTACGGDESSTPLAGSADSTTNTSDSGTGADSGGTTDAPTVSLELGTGSGADFQSGQISTSASNLSFGQVVRLDFNVVNAADGNTIYNVTPTSVAVSSLCEASVFDTPVTSSSGAFSITYETGCAGTDTITARLENGATAITNITVAQQEVGALEFVSVDPDSIALAGSANSVRGSTSNITFKLTNTSGNPISGAPITFSLSTDVGGISLTHESGETGPEGTVKTTLNAGSVPTVVSVTATHTLADGSRIQSTSDPISVSAAIPDQDSFSLAVEVEAGRTPNARNYDGVEVPLTIRAADRNNNRVEGAVVNFLTNGGSIQSECILVDGACTVTWVSQNPRPDSGVVVILARTVGEESFVDLNSDGKYTQTDGFDLASDDKGEAFLDRNWNGQRDANEEYFDYNSNGQFDVANGKYNGTACADVESVCTTNLLEITNSQRLYMASDVIDVTITNETMDDTQPITAPGLVCARIAGVYENKAGDIVAGAPPGGTDVEFSTTKGTIAAPNTFTLSKDFTTEPAVKCVSVESDGSAGDGTVSVKVTPPSPYGGEGDVFIAPITDPVIL